MVTRPMGQLQESTRPAHNIKILGNTFGEPPSSSWQRRLTGAAVTSKGPGDKSHTGTCSGLNHIS